MKKAILNYLILAGIIVMTIFGGCKKNSFDTETIIKPITANERSEIVKYMTSQVSNATTSEGKYIDSVLNRINWLEGKRLKLDNNKLIFHVPLTSKDIGLTIVYDENKKTVDTANVIVLRSSPNDNSPAILKVATFYNILESKYKNKASFKIEAYSLKNKFKYEYKIVDGKILYAKFILPYPKKETAGTIVIKKDAIVCTHYYWVTQNWNTGIAHWEYLFSECKDDNNCPTTTSIDIINGQQYQKTSCGGGDPNGGTPGPPTDPNCALTSEQALAEISENEISGVNEDPTYTVSGAATTEASGKIREPHISQLKVLKFKLKGIYEVYYSIFYDAIRYKNSSTDQVWKWDTFDFINSGQSSGTLPPCYDVHTTIVATQHGVISNDQTKAEITFNAYGWYRLICVGGSQVPPGITIGHNQTFFAAHP